VRIEVKVPVLAESVAEATLLSWHKNVGDTVSRGDSLIDIETDKVTLEVAAPNDGVLAEILKQNGEEVHSDEVLARIETGAHKGAATAPSISPEPAKTAKPLATGVPPAQQSLPDMALPGKHAADTKLSPAVRNLLAGHNLSAEDIPTEGDRLTKEDVLKYIEKKAVKVPAAAIGPAAPPATSQTPVKTGIRPQPQPESRPETRAASTAATPAAPKMDPGSGRPVERIPMTRLRRRAAERLLMAQRENAILTTFNEVNMQPVIDLRNRYKDEFEKIHGVKLGLMSFFSKAAVEALKKFPIINASVDGEDIIYHSYYDIGIAVSSPRGLVVPVIRDADTLSFANIEARIRDYGDKARNAKLTIEDLTGGTFTITNGGVFGSLLSTPIINPPQSAILGMHKMQERPVAEKGQVVIRPMMYLAVSYDHRIIDGREAVQFLVAIKEQIEDPTRLLLQV
jgi:2-oxoglutarate dehydrogenase E2 component (dihydrolipoamide succinyltransferase)